jgi:tetratricopeptide (TPR) repeat protein
VEPLNANLVPSGGKREVPVEEFEERFELEPEFFFNPEANKIRKVWKANPDKERAAGGVIDDESAGAEAAAIQVPEPDGSFGLDLDDPLDDAQDVPMDLDEEPGQQAVPEPVRRADLRRKADAGDEDDEQERSARADFGIGLAYLKRGDADKARRIFEELADREGDWQLHHKFMFNDFGIGLRKSRLGETAVRHYEKALALSPDDENLYHNLARVYYELGDTNNAVRNLKKSLDINPDLKESRMFLDYIRRRSASGGALKLDI